jgi:hypothetical protein
MDEVQARRETVRAGARIPRMTKHASSAAALALALVTAAGCSSDGSEGDPADGGTSAKISCEGDPRSTEYVANVTRHGAAMEFTLMNAEPAPPAQGMNSWTVRVAQNGQPVKGLKLEVTPFMPDHAHGSAAVPAVTDNGDGTFAISNLYLVMPGLWETTLTATVEGTSVTDRAVFTFCVGN